MSNKENERRRKTEKMKREREENRYKIKKIEEEQQKISDQLKWLNYGKKNDGIKVKT